MEGLRSESERECFGSRRILDLKLRWRSGGSSVWEGIWGYDDATYSDF